MTQFILAVYLSRIILRICKPTTRSKKAKDIENELIINRKALNTLGLTVPPSLLAPALIE